MGGRLRGFTKVAKLLQQFEDIPESEAPPESVYDGQSVIDPSRRGTMTVEMGNVDFLDLIKQTKGILGDF